MTGITMIPSNEVTRALNEYAKQMWRTRPDKGPRGTLLECANPTEDNPGEALICLEPIGPEISLRNDVRDLFSESVMYMGEQGGKENLVRLNALLHDVLKGTISLHERCQAALVSAIGNIGGPDAINALVDAIQYGSENTATCAVLALENIATDGAPALTEYSEPKTIESLEEYQAFVNLDSRLRTAITTRSDYTRTKGRELLGIIYYSIEDWEKKHKAPVLAL